MTMSRIGTLTGWILAAALTALCWRSAGGAQFLLLVLSSFVALWLAVTIAVCAAAQHRRIAANTQLLRKRHASGAVTAPHLRR